MQTFRTFGSADEARAYRHENGTGGWIFDPDPGVSLSAWSAEAILFPPEMTPSSIFRHPLTQGRSGNLIGHG